MYNDNIRIKIFDGRQHDETGIDEFLQDVYTWLQRDKLPSEINRGWTAARYLDAQFG